MYVLQNDRLTVTVRPDLGGRIDQVLDARTGKEWLWHPLSYRGETRQLPVGASFDDFWSGGFDEIFPNDAPGESQGRQLPVHGELWSQRWQVVEREPNGMKLFYQCGSVPVAVEKTILLESGQPECKISYLFKNLDAAPLDFLFKLHPALALEPGDEIVMPDCLVQPVDLGFSRILKRGDWQPWHQAGLTKVPPKGDLQEFVYAKELASGFCGLHNRRTGTVLSLNFAREQFPFVWLFQVYGGWRDAYTLVTEPATTMPWDLTAARAAGTCAILRPHEQRRYDVTLRIDRVSKT